MPKAKQDGNGENLSDVPKETEQLKRGRPDLGRRQVIIASAANLSFKIGLGSLTHRSIAEEARVPLGSMTYHFRSIEDIQLEVARYVTNARTAPFIQKLAQIPPDRTAEVADCLLQVLVPVGIEPLNAYRWYLEAARIDAIRPVIAEWNFLIINLLVGHFGLTKAIAEDIIALADGLLLNVVVHGAFPITITERLESGIVRLLN